MTTELEAVNSMLSAVGEAPVASLEGPLPTDVVLARNILQRTSREVQEQGWRFNTEFGLEMTHDATMEWTSGPFVETLYIFKAPADLLSFRIHRSPNQQGAFYVDTEIRPSRVYRENGEAVKVFYDRTFNRDGFARRPYLYIDPVWYFDFEHLPPVAQHYIVIRASRRFQQQVAGNADLAQLSLYDEQEALAQLRREQGRKDNYNIFKNHSVNRVFGNRPFGSSGSLDYRATRGQR